MSRYSLIALLFLSPPLHAAEGEDANSRLIARHGLKVRVDGADDETWKELRAVVDLQLTLVDDTAPTPPLADDLAFFVGKELLKLGYPETRVTWSIEGDVAVLNVTEGGRETIGETTFTGTEAATPEEMREYLLSPTKERRGSLGKGAPLVEMEIADGAGLVQRLLQSRGYLGATAGAPRYVRSPGKPTDIFLSINEGPRSLFGEIYINGELPPEAEPVRASVAALKGTPYSEVRVEEIRAKVESKCQAAGHFAAKVIAEAKPGKAGGAVPVILAVTKGPVHLVRRIEAAEAFSSGAQRIIEAGFRPAEGAVWSTSDLELMQRRVMDTGVFATMDIEPQSLSEREAELVLRISGTEGMRKTLAIYGGYETLKGPLLGLEWRHVNFADTGNTLRLRLGWEAGGPEASVRWINPAIFNSAYTSDTELSALTSSAYDYTHRSLKLRSALSRQYSRHLAASVYGAISADTASGGGLTPEELGPKSYSMTALGGTVSFDYRDSPINPRKGWFASAELETGIADVAYLKTALRLSYYRPITESFRFAANWQAAAIAAPDGVSSLPIDMRLFNGGSSTVRSFGERELGAQSTGGTPLGGTLMHAANLELSYEVIENLELAVFADAGSLSREDDNLWAIPEDLRYAIGLGVRYALPVGPLRVDYGYNPDRRDGEPSGALHITFGFAF
jgi:outer membrane protein insertion porin family